MHLIIKVTSSQACLQHQRVTEGQTDGFTIANTALCIASYADAL